MVALYGPWGCGKTTILKTVATNLSDIYIPIFFDSWKFEKDWNLPASLFDAICNEIPKNEKEAITPQKKIKALLIGSIKSIKLDFQLLEIDLKEIIEEIKTEGIRSQYQLNNEFAKNFAIIEDSIIRNSGKKLLIIIDDLDRCEPENVLTLISSLKLFFSLGHNSVFLVGIDKNALENAICLQYRDVVKSSEYLEKVFDFSFSVDVTFDLTRFVEYYFSEYHAFYHNKYQTLIHFLNDFLLFNRLTNPRHLKKVLNKFRFLVWLKKMEVDNCMYIPSIGPSSPSIHSIIFTLFFIYLYEFHRDQYNRLDAYDNKLMNYTQHIIELRRKESNKNIDMAGNRVNGHMRIKLDDPLVKYLQTIIMQRETASGKNEAFRFICTFLPYADSEIQFSKVPNSITTFIGNFAGSKDQECYLFANYLNQLYYRGDQELFNPKFDSYHDFLIDELERVEPDYKVEYLFQIMKLFS